VSQSDDDVPSEDFVFRLKDEDRQIVEDLYALHSRSVRAQVATIVKTRDENVLDDVCQQVWITVIRKLDTYAAGASVLTWLTAIATNVSLNYLRAERRRKAIRPVPPELPSAESLEPLAREAFRVELEAALRELPFVQSQVFRLVHLKGLTYTRVQDLTGVAPSTLKTRMVAAREALRERLAHWAPERRNNRPRRPSADRNPYNEEQAS
jgi:RNA polymerase sigma-70 factor (ECF subfamily)